MRAYLLWIVLLCSTQSAALSSDAVDMLPLLQPMVQPQEQPSSQVEKYNRKKHFGGWVQQGKKIACQNTRALVLIQQSTSKEDIELSDSQCSVVSGVWDEPYTGEQYTKALDLQIDHVVALREAYYTGAWKWKSARRCHYANYIQNDFHLLAVYGKENETKSDNGPEEYLPPNQSFHCQYVSYWMKIKLIWELTLSSDEMKAIKKVVKDEDCSSEDLQVSKSWLKKQRQLSYQPIEQCQDF